MNFNPLGLLASLCYLLCWFAPFTFACCLVFAIKDAVAGKGHDITLSAAAAFSLLVMLAVCVLRG